LTSWEVRTSSRSHAWSLSSMVLPCERNWSASSREMAEMAALLNVTRATLCAFFVSQARCIAEWMRWAGTVSNSPLMSSTCGSVGTT